MADKTAIRVAVPTDLAGYVQHVRRLAGVKTEEVYIALLEMATHRLDPVECSRMVSLHMSKQRKQAARKEKVSE